MYLWVYSRVTRIITECNRYPLTIAECNRCPLTNSELTMTKVLSCQLTTHPKDKVLKSRFRTSEQIEISYMESTRRNALRQKGRDVDLVTGIWGHLWPPVKAAKNKCSLVLHLSRAFCTDYYQGSYLYLLPSSSLFLKQINCVTFLKLCPSDFLFIIGDEPMTQAGCLTSRNSGAHPTAGTLLVPWTGARHNNINL